MKKKWTNAEHGEENVQVKAHAIYTDEWSELKWGNLVWLEYFEQYKKIKKWLTK